MFGGIGVTELIIIAVILGGGGMFFRSGGSIRIAGPTLVLRSFKIDETPSTTVPVDIVGRASGITAWVLTSMGFGTESSLKMTDKEVSIKTSSLFGETYQVVTLPSISSTHCGYSKPIGYLIIGVIIVIGGLLNGLRNYYGFFNQLASLLPGLIIGGIFLIAYYLSKKIFIAVETRGGKPLGLSFKRSVIENVSFDLNQALKVIHIINQKVIESQVKYP
jgi:hypothetical protein